MGEVIPEELRETLGTVNARLEALHGHVQNTLLPALLSNDSPLSPVDRASAYLTLSKTLNTLLLLHLRSRGESICNNHIVNSESERLNLYAEKFVRYRYKSTAPIRPTSSIDIAATNRFIEHAIPDLTQEQKEEMRELTKAGKKQSRQKSGQMSGGTILDLEHTQSLTEAVSTFLTEASKEVLAADQSQGLERGGGDNKA